MLAKSRERGEREVDVTNSGMIFPRSSNLEKSGSVEPFMFFLAMYSTVDPKS